MHSSQLHLLMPAIESLVLLLYPLTPGGLIIPYLPQGLHPDPETLLNDSPDPFMIGIHSAFLASLRLLPPEEHGPIVLDLDQARSLACPSSLLPSAPAPAHEAPTPRLALPPPQGAVTAPQSLYDLLRLPMVRELAVELTTCFRGGIGVDLTHVQGAFIGAMSSLVSVSGGKLKESKLPADRQLHEHIATLQGFCDYMLMREAADTMGSVVSCVGGLAPPDAKSTTAPQPQQGSERPEEPPGATPAGAEVSVQLATPRGRHFSVAVAAPETRAPQVLDKLAEAAATMEQRSAQLHELKMEYLLANLTDERLAPLSPQGRFVASIYRSRMFLEFWRQPENANLAGGTATAHLLRLRGAALREALADHAVALDVVESKLQQQQLVPAVPSSEDDHPAETAAEAAKAADAWRSGTAPSDTWLRAEARLLGALRGVRAGGGPALDAADVAAHPLANACLLAHLLQAPLPRAAPSAAAGGSSPFGTPRKAKTPRGRSEPTPPRGGSDPRKPRRSRKASGLAAILDPLGVAQALSRRRSSPARASLLAAADALTGHSPSGGGAGGSRESDVEQQETERALEALAYAASRASAAMRSRRRPPPAPQRQSAKRCSLRTRRTSARWRPRRRRRAG